MLTNKKSIRIEWGDCDPAGIVFFPRYLAYFDACTMSLFEKAGLPKAALLREHGIIGFPVVELRTRFSKPSSFGDDVTVESRITRWGRASFDVEHRLSRIDGLAVKGFETRVWAESRGGLSPKLKVKPIPAEVKELFLTAGGQPAARTGGDPS